MVSLFWFSAKCLVLNVITCSLQTNTFVLCQLLVSLLVLLDDGWHVSVFVCMVAFVESTSTNDGFCRYCLTTNRIHNHRAYLFRLLPFSEITHFILHLYSNGCTEYPNWNLTFKVVTHIVSSAFVSSAWGFWALSASTMLCLSDMAHFLHSQWVLWILGNRVECATANEFSATEESC